MKTSEKVSGIHLILNLKGCNKKILSSFDECYDFLRYTPLEIGMKIIDGPHIMRFDKFQGCPFKKWGFTGVSILAESHISIHTIPEMNKAAIDIFSCAPFNTNKILKIILNKFGGEIDKSWILKRSFF